MPDTPWHHNGFSRTLDTLYDAILVPEVFVLGGELVTLLDFQVVLPEVGQGFIILPFRKMLGFNEAFGETTTH